jgi:hypothetical protein
MYALKRISPDSLERALTKAERYRLLNEPGEAESISRDILELEPNNQKALVSLILALSDQIAQRAAAFDQAAATVDRLESGYERAYYLGLAWERRAKARYQGGGPGSHHYVYEWIVKALGYFEQAEQLRPPGNDDAVLRWNACVRLLSRDQGLKPRPEDTPEPILSE